MTTKNTKKMKGGEEGMEIVEIMSKGYIETCPICNKKFKPARSKSQAKWNLEIHMRANHPEQEDGKE